MSEYITEITDDNFEDEVISKKGVVLVDFWASWCGPCAIAAPVVEKIAKDLKGKVKVCKLNVDENRKIASQFGIMSIPTFIIFKDGSEADRIVGLISESEIRKRTEKYLA